MRAHCLEASPRVDGHSVENSLESHPIQVDPHKIIIKNTLLCEIEQLYKFSTTLFPNISLVEQHTLHNNISRHLSKIKLVRHCTIIATQRLNSTSKFTAWHKDSV